MKSIKIAGVSFKKDNPPTRETLIKQALFTGKMKEADIITEIDSHELYRGVSERPSEANEQGSDSTESERTNSAKRKEHNKPG